MSVEISVVPGADTEVVTKVVEVLVERGTTSVDTVNVVVDICVELEEGVLIVDVETMVEEE